MQEHCNRDAKAVQLGCENTATGMQEQCNRDAKAVQPESVANEQVA